MCISFGCHAVFFRGSLHLQMHLELYGENSLVTELDKAIEMQKWVISLPFAFLSVVAMCLPMKKVCPCGLWRGFSPFCPYLLFLFFSSAWTRVLVRAVVRQQERERYHYIFGPEDFDILFDSYELIFNLPLVGFRISIEGVDFVCHPSFGGCVATKMC